MTYIVMSRSAKMPTSVKARYSRVGLVKVAPGYEAINNEPKMLSPRAKGVLEVVTVWERLHDGTTGGNSAAARARRELQARADRLNTEATALLTANL